MDERILICGSLGSFPDDLYTTCPLPCGRKIVYRPHLAHIKKKVCLQCGSKLIKGESGPVRIEITNKVRQEVLAHRNAWKN